MRLVTAAWTLVVLLAIAGTLRAADQAKPAEGKPRQYGPVPFPGLEKLTLTDDQKAKLAALRKEYGPKLAALGRKMEAVYTDEQRKALHDAAQAARTAGKSPSEIAQAVHAAIHLADDQKAKLRDAWKELQPLRQEFREKVMHSLNLTPEQKDQLEALNPANAYKPGGQKPKKSDDNK